VATLFPVFEANPMDAAAVELDLSPVRSLVGMAAVWPIEHLVLLQQAANSEKKRIIHCHIQRQKSGRDSTKLSAMTIATTRPNTAVAKRGHSGRTLASACIVIT
jgi:hypothetical protein